MTDAMRTHRAVFALAVIASLTACKKDADAPAKQPPPSATIDAKVAPAAAPDAASKPASTDAAPTADGPVKAFFYEVTKDGKTSHLLGTMHIGVDPTRLPPAVYASLDKSKAFAMETNLMDPSLIGDIMRQDGKTLEDDLGPDYWKKLQDAIGANMADNLKNMKPSAAASVLELRGLPMTQPMDLVLLQRAQKNGAKIVYLEEARLQEKILDKWLDVQGLKEMLDDIASGQDKNQEMLDAYVQGNEDVVSKLTADKSSWKRSPAEFDAMMKDLLYDRNASWIPELEKMFTDGDAFVAVGAAHLIGDRSVTDLLKKDGFTITRVGQ
jgi:uncharacterized protein YbaP (TraB family)